MQPSSFSLLLLLLSFFLLLSLSYGFTEVQYFADISTKEGAKSHESGFVYFVKRAGSGTVHPQLGQPVAIYYKATTTKGIEVDNTMKRGHADRIIVGDGILPIFKVILPMMVVGDRWEVHVPSRLAFGEKGNGKVGPYETVIYDIELADLKANWKPKEKKEDKPKDL